MRTRSLKTIFYSILMLLLGTFITVAQPPQGEKEKKRPSIEELFKQMDANKDGKLSKTEIKGPLKDDFAKIDLNKDGYLTKEEMKKAPKPERRKPENNSK